MSKKKFRVFTSPNFLKTANTFSDNNPVKIGVNQVIEAMKQDENLGDYIKKKHWPDKYVKAHEVTNLYRREISGNHRLIYTIRGRKEDKIYQLLDLLTHKEYDRTDCSGTTRRS